MKKNGFTIIELLGVIIILVALTLIALPTIINSISRSSNKTNEVTNKLIFNAAKLYMNDHKNSFLKQYGMNYCISLRQLVDHNYLKSIVDYSNNENDITDIDSVRVKYNNGYQYELTDNYSCKKGPYVAGDIVYFDPVGDKNCNSSTFDFSSIKSGNSTCYRWMVIKKGDSSSTQTLDLMLDHNLINTVQWSNATDENSNYINTVGPNSALASLAAATSSWEKVSKLNYTYDTSGATSNYGILTCVDGTCTNGAGTQLATNLRARLLTAEEVKSIVNTKAGTDAESKTWTIANSYQNGYYFSNVNYLVGTKTPATSGDTSLSWLLENTNSESRFDSSMITPNQYGTDNFGYWTLTPVSDLAGYAWVVAVSGNLGADRIDYNQYYGVRPVITIEKTKL